MYKRILLKLSGEALAGNEKVYDMDFLENLAEEIKQIVSDGTGVGIVIGGGNICRGKMFEKLGLDRVEADYTGMLGTVVNAVLVAAALNKCGCKAKAMTVIKAQNVEDFSIRKANQYLKEGYTLVFGGGYGKPYHSTDTGSAQKAKDIKAEIILMGKNGVDGVYDKDPDDHPDAVRYDEMTFDDIIDNGLGVIDLEAAKMCKENKIEAFIFNMNGKGNIVKAARGQIIGTHVRV